MYASPHFDIYRAEPQFAARMPDLSNKRFDDEIQDLSDDEHVISCRVAPDDAAQCTITSFDDACSGDGGWLVRDRENKYLWLVLCDDVKLCLEIGEPGRSTQRGRLAHTNLSGNVPAHCGGEL